MNDELELARAEMRLVILGAIEGAVDRFVGRPDTENPFDLDFAPGQSRGWVWGWARADLLLADRGADAAREWLSTGAA